jgi:EAL domain-containing protein (putative c-di-GMP-specific phosphodiesterase class I)
MAAKCEFAQGYLFSPPLAASAAAALLRKEGMKILPAAPLCA